MPESCTGTHIPGMSGLSALSISLNQPQGITQTPVCRMNLMTILRLVPLNHSPGSAIPTVLLYFSLDHSSNSLFFVHPAAFHLESHRIDVQKLIDVITYVPELWSVIRASHTVRVYCITTFVDITVEARLA